MTEFLNDPEHDVTDETHRATCADCATVWAELEQISAQARELPRLTPSRDLWAGIESRITDRVGDATPTLANAPRKATPALRWMSSPTVRLATAASLLVAATAAVTWTLATGPAATVPAAQVATSTLSSPAAPVTTGPDLEEAFGVPTSVVGRMQQAKLDETVQSMDREIADLQKLLDERRTTLDPKTIAVLEASMTLIDVAIEESRKALAADPASRFLATQYTRAYTSKLTLLRDAATLPSGD